MRIAGCIVNKQRHLQNQCCVSLASELISIEHVTSLLSMLPLVEQLQSVMQNRHQHMDEEDRSCSNG